jgi:hypothetical protein
MAMRAWQVWGIAAVLVSGLSASAKPPAVPAKTEVDGKVPPPITQDHYQPAKLPPPRLLPESVLDPKPRHGPETAASDVDVPVRFSSYGRRFTLQSENGRSLDWKARAAFDMAEEHRRSCDLPEARQWYREVIKLAPGSNLAQAALDRLREGQVISAGATETREPPLADAVDIPELQLRVLWEAASQFKEAVDSGDKHSIEKCGRSLGAALKQTTPASATGRNR